MTNKKTAKNPRSNNSYLTFGVLFLIFLGFFLIFLLKNSTTNENLREEKSSSFETNSEDKQLTATTINGQNNLSNIINSNITTNSNNKIDQKTENNFIQSSKVINNYQEESSPRQTKENSSRKPQSNPPVHNQGVLQQIETSPPASESTFNDPIISEYLKTIETHRNNGVDLSKCSSIQICLEDYKNWQNEGIALLINIDKYFRQRYGKRSELEQEFGSETLSIQNFPETKESFEGIKRIFFLRADFFGLLKSKVRRI